MADGSQRERETKEEESYHPAFPSPTAKWERWLSFLGGSIPHRTESQWVFRPVPSISLWLISTVCSWWKLTVPMLVVSNPARASIPRIRDISWTSCFVSRALVDLDRSCEIFARKQGCWETWTLLGREAILSNSSRKEDLSRSHQRSGASDN